MVSKERTEPSPIRGTVFAGEGSLIALATWLTAKLNSISNGDDVYVIVSRGSNGTDRKFR